MSYPRSFYLLCVRREGGTAFVTIFKIIFFVALLSRRFAFPVLFLLFLSRLSLASLFLLRPFAMLSGFPLKPRL